MDGRSVSVTVGTDTDAGAGSSRYCRWNVNRRRAEDDFAMGGGGHQREELIEEGSGFCRRFEHLPIAGHHVSLGAPQHRIDGHAYQHPPLRHRRHHHHRSLDYSHRRPLQLIVAGGTHVHVV